MVSVKHKNRSVCTHTLQHIPRGTLQRCSHVAMASASLGQRAVVSDHLFSFPPCLFSKDSVINSLTRDQTQQQQRAQDLPAAPCVVQWLMEHACNNTHQSSVRLTTFKLVYLCICLCTFLCFVCTCLYVLHLISWHEIYFFFFCMQTYAHCSLHASDYRGVACRPEVNISEAVWAETTIWVSEVAGLVYSN